MCFVVRICTLNYFRLFFKIEASQLRALRTLVSATKHSLKVREHKKIKTAKQFTVRIPFLTLSLTAMS